MWAGGARRGGRGVMEVQCSCIKLTHNPSLKSASYGLDKGEDGMLMLRV